VNLQWPPRPGGLRQSALVVDGLALEPQGSTNQTIAHPPRPEPKLAALAATPPEAALESEAAKIKGAIRTDFILSAEIIAITLGTVADQDFTRQLLVLSAIAMVMTVGVYGMVAGIVKLDDAGLYLSQRRSAIQQKLGRLILRAAPFLMKFLSIAGTAAMFLVGGGILTHGIPWLHHGIAQVTESLARAGAIGGFLAPITTILLDGLCGLAAGIIVLLLVTGFRKLRGKHGESSREQDVQPLGKR